MMAIPAAALSLSANEPIFLTIRSGSIVASLAVLTIDHRGQSGARQISNKHIPGAAFLASSGDHGNPQIALTMKRFT